MKTDPVSVIALIEEFLLEDEKVPELLLFLLYRISLQGVNIQALVSHLEYWEVSRQYTTFIEDEMGAAILGRALLARIEFCERQDKVSLEAFRKCCDTVYVQALLANDPEIFLRADKVVVMAMTLVRYPKKEGSLPLPPSQIGAFFRQLRKNIARQLFAEIQAKS